VADSPVNPRIPAQVIVQAVNYWVQGWGTGRVIKMNIGSLPAAPGRNQAVSSDNLAAKALEGKTPLFNVYPTSGSV